MKTNQWISLALTLTGSLAIGGQAAAQVSGDVPSPPSTKGESESRVHANPLRDTAPVLSSEDEQLIHAMPLTQKVGQLLMIGFMGSKINEGLGDRIKSLSPGAVVVFGRNIKTARQILDLNREAQRASIGKTKLPLFIAVDQEGGNVVRIKTAYPLPSALALGLSGKTELVERAGLATGSLLKTLGFNMNLAPVLDVGDPSEPSFIGTRTFGRNPKVVGTMGLHFAAGLNRSGILPTVKHFPGHGGVKEDSHLQTLEKNATLTELERHDLVPFKTMAVRFTRPWSVMLAHIAYPALDPSGLPATFSRPIVQGLLREKMGFSGLVITDDIEMAGANVVGDVSERAVRTIEAGVDMIMIAWNKKIQTRVHDALVKAVKSGRLSETRIDESVRRILAVKRAYHAGIQAPMKSAELLLAIRNPAFKEIAENTITARFEQPAEREELEFVESALERPLIVFSANERFNSGFKEALGGRRIRIVPVGVGLGLDPDRVMRSNPNAVGIFYVSSPILAKLASRMSKDVTRRTLLVTVEPLGLVRNATAFGHVADIYYRHPNLGALVAKRFFNKTAVEIQNARFPARNTNEGVTNSDEAPAHPESAP